LKTLLLMISQIKNLTFIFCVKIKVGETNGYTLLKIQA